MRHVESFVVRRLLIDRATAYINRILRRVGPIGARTCRLMRALPAYLSIGWEVPPCSGGHRAGQ